MVSVVTTLRRYVSTVRHLRVIQVVDRLKRSIYRPSARRIEVVGISKIIDWSAPIAGPPRLVGPSELSVLNVRRSIGSPAFWGDPEIDRLWLYHAHYFDDLCAQGAVDRQVWHERLIRRWIDENAPGSSPGWEPYPSSRRIVNWLKWHLVGGDLDKTARESLASQADLLHRNLEYHLLGNHLLANAKALIFAGTLLRTSRSEKWRNKGLSLLRQQIDEQILPDGGHFELSPMYHAVVIEDFLDLVNLTKKQDPEFANDLCNLCGRMLYWLRVVAHPDGQIALFNDSTLDACPPPEALERYAARLSVPQSDALAPGLTLLPDSGYGRLDLGRFVAIVDVGSIGPDYLPGHAHADTLTFELSVDGVRIVVDTGTSTYSDTAARHYQRATQAHNTIALDGLNSSEVWSSFRVGRRARPRPASTTENSKVVSLEGGHDGYIAHSVIHKRRWTLTANGLHICDQLTGKGTHDVESFLHFHPDVSIHGITERIYELTHPMLASHLRITMDAGLSITRRDSTYSPEFGLSIENGILTAKARAKMPFQFSFRIELHAAAV